MPKRKRDSGEQPLRKSLRLSTSLSPHDKEDEVKEWPEEGPASCSSSGSSKESDESLTTRELSSNQRPAEHKTAGTSAESLTTRELSSNQRPAEHKTAGTSAGQVSRKVSRFYVSSSTETSVSEIHEEVLNVSHSSDSNFNEDPDWNRFLDDTDIPTPRLRKKKKLRKHWAGQKVRK